MEKHDQTSINLIDVFNLMSASYIGFDEINWLWVFTKYTARKFIAKQQSTSISWCWLQLVHLILNAKNLMQKTSENVFLRHVGEWVFDIFPILPLIMGAPPPPPLQYLLEFSWIFIQHSVAASKMELFLRKNR